MLLSSSASHPTISGFLWSWHWSTACYHFAITVIAAAVAAVTNYYSSHISSVVFGYCIIALCVVEKILRDVQSVFVFFGLWRNVLYPENSANLLDFKQRKRKLFVLGVLRRIINNWGMIWFFYSDFFFSWKLFFHKPFAKYYYYNALPSSLGKLDEMNLQFVLTYIYLVHLTKLFLVLCFDIVFPCAFVFFLLILTFSFSIVCFILVTFHVWRASFYCQ